MIGILKSTSATAHSKNPAINRNLEKRVMGSPPTFERKKEIQPQYRAYNTKTDI